MKGSSSLPKDHFPGQNAVVSFVVDDVEEMHKKLDLDGFVSESITSLSGVFYCFLFYDKDGDKFQIIQFI